MKDYQYHIFSPYRVCPLGAHVDHQHGLVTGFAIDKGVDLWFDVREDSLVKLSSRTFEGDVEFHVNTPSQVKERHWGDYARGAKYALRKRFELSHGIEGVIQGSLPVGGLSSSAAVLIAYVMAFAKANDITLQPFEVVKIASEAEREYIGLNNGLLDQACIALGKKDGLLFLDCDSNDWRIIKRNPDMPKFEIGILPCQVSNLLFQYSRFVEICHNCNGQGENERGDETVVEEQKCLVESKDVRQFVKHADNLFVVAAQSGLLIKCFYVSRCEHCVEGIEEFALVDEGKIDVFHATAEQAGIHEDTQHVHIGEQERHRDFQLHRTFFYTHSQEEFNGKQEQQHEHA